MGGFLVSLGLVSRPARCGYVGRSAAWWQRETGPDDHDAEADGVGTPARLGAQPVNTAHLRRLFSTSSAREHSSLIAVSNSFGVLLSPTQVTVCFLSPRTTVRLI